MDIVYYFIGGILMAIIMSFKNKEKATAKKIIAILLFVIIWIVINWLSIQHMATIGSDMMPLIDIIALIIFGVIDYKIVNKFVK